MQPEFHYYTVILGYFFLQRSASKHVFNSYSLSQMTIAVFYSPCYVHHVASKAADFLLQTVMCTSCWKPGCNINIAKRLLYVMLEGLDQFLVTEHLQDRAVMTTGNV